MLSQILVVVGTAKNTCFSIIYPNVIPEESPVHLSLILGGLAKLKQHPLQKLLVFLGNCLGMATHKFSVCSKFDRRRGFFKTKRSQLILIG